MSPTKTHITGVRAVSIPVEKQDDAASQSKATSAATKPSNARCRAAPASTSSGKESCSVTDTTQSHQFTGFMPEPDPYGHQHPAALRISKSRRYHADSLIPAKANRPATSS
jgi:hypothetical protein